MKKVTYEYLCHTSMYDDETGECLFHAGKVYEGFIDGDDLRVTAEDCSEVAFEDDWDEVFEED